MLAVDILLQHFEKCPAFAGGNFEIEFSDFPIEKFPNASIVHFQKTKWTLLQTGRSDRTQ
jgi:hypothetical protein